MAGHVPQRLRILHCAETIQGGIASYLRELLILQAAEYGAQAVTVVVPASQLRQLPVPDGVRIVTYADGPGRTANAFRLAQAVLRCLGTTGASIVHVHSTFAGVTVRPLAALASRARVVYCAHGWAWDRPMHPLAQVAVRLVEATLARVSARVICISEHEYHSAIANGLPPARVALVRNGVASARAHSDGFRAPWPDGRLRVLFVGRWDRQKGVDILFAAMRELADEAHVVVAGGEVLADAGGLALPANASHVGWVNPARLEALFDSADVLVMPSRWEGFGLVAVEAMRAGLPVVASRVGGLQEVVADGVTGVLVEPESPQAIVAALRSRSNSEWRAMSKDCRARFAAHFTMERVHREIASIYKTDAASVRRAPSADA